MPDIPDIEIPTIEIRPIPEPHVFPPPVTQNLAPRPIYQKPGCARVHRDAHLNPSLLRDDPNGVGITCPEGEMPSYVPLDWNPRKLQIIEPTPVQNNEQEQPPAGQKADPKPPPPKDKPQPEVKCPPADAAEVGTLSPNGRKILESYELVDGVCKEVYRNVPVTEQLIKAVPSPYEAAQTAGIAVVATTAALSTPFLVRIIKPVVKKLLTKAKEIVTRKKEARPSTFLRKQAQRKARK